MIKTFATQMLEQETISMNQLLMKYVQPELQKHFPYADEEINLAMLNNIIRPRSAMDKRRANWVQQRGHEHYELAKQALEAYGTQNFKPALETLINKLRQWYAEDSPKGVVNKEELRTIDKKLIQEAGIDLTELDIRVLSEDPQKEKRPVVAAMKKGFKLAYAEMYYEYNAKPLQDWFEEYRWFYDNSQKIKETYQQASFWLRKQKQQPKIDLNQFSIRLLKFTFEHDPELREAFEEQNTEQIIYILSPEYSQHEKTEKAKQTTDTMAGPVYRQVIEEAKREGFLPLMTITDFQRAVTPGLPGFVPEMKSAYDDKDIESLVLQMAS